MGIWLIRHAQSTHNAYGVIEYDVGITDHGKNQANAIVGHANLVIISNLKRTKETLENSKITYDNLIISTMCREHMNGCITNFIEGETKTETWQELSERINKFKEFLIEQNKIHKDIYVITHWGPLVCLVNNGNIGNCQVISYDIK
jgi:broad specificity phosphatase PhoE